MSTYLIPYQDAYVVYRPLKQLAFMANGAMVNVIAGIRDTPQLPRDASQSEAARFLDSIGFFEPDPPAFSTPFADFKPTVAVCLMTTACNFRCIYCYASGGEERTSPPEALPFELGRRAIDIVCCNAIELGESWFTLGFHGGGEPTLARDSFRRLVAHARQKPLPCRISVASNGYWSRSERDWILDHLDEVSLSFDGSPALQNRQRPLSSGKASFARVMASIRAMDLRNFPYGIRMTVTDAGIEALPEAVAFLCQETNCGTIQIEPAFDHGRAQRADLALCQNERFADAFLIAHDIAAAKGRHAYYSGARPWVVTDRFCRAIDRALIVAPDGGLTACYEVYGREHSLAPRFFFGTLDANTGIQMASATRAQLQEQIAERRGLCEGCFCYWHCAGDCPPKTLSLSGNGHRRFGARCDLNRLITRELLLRNIAAGQGVWRGQTGIPQTPLETLR
jgi:uncharacterized protein